ncbi:MAG: hypothetical protein J4473_01405 [Candidatus Aenigmarchaeota archaeon]|nr:hypothetical protein [Candidatus Aenigmarchaeota archaeon]
MVENGSDVDINLCCYVLHTFSFMVSKKDVMEAIQKLKNSDVDDKFFRHLLLELDRSIDKRLALEIMEFYSKAMEKRRRYSYTRRH